MKISRQYLAFIIIFTAWMGSATGFAAAAEIKDDPALVKIAEKMRQKTGAIGFNVAIITPDGKEHTASVGVENKVTKTPLNSSHVMLAGSTGKVMFSAVALMLVDEGVIDLDTPISKWISDESWFDRLPNKDTITIRMLMNHSSGLINHVDHKDFLAVVNPAFKKNPDYKVSITDSLSYLLDREPLFEAGEKMAYSDTNYILMAYIVEKVTGRSFYDLIEERILKPYGLKNIHAQKSRHIPNLATGHLRRGKNLFAIDSDTNMGEDGKLLFNPVFEYAGGGYAANALALARLAKVLYVKKLISDKLFTEMATTLAMINRPAIKIGYGLGYMKFETKYGVATGHSGYNVGYRTEMYMFEKEGVIVALMANQTSGISPSEMAFDIADQYMKAAGIRTATVPAEKK